MQRLLLASILLSAVSLASCQREERTLVDLLRFPDEVRTVVIAPDYESWYQEAGEKRVDRAPLDEERLSQNYDEEGDEDADVEDAGETSAEDYNSPDDEWQEDGLETVTQGE